MPLHFCLQTNKQRCCLLRLTNHSSAFGPKLNMFYLAPISGTRKVWQTDQFLVPVDWYQKQAPETGQCVITIRKCTIYYCIQPCLVSLHDANSIYNHMKRWLYIINNIQNNQSHILSILIRVKTMGNDRKIHKIGQAVHKLCKLAYKRLH